MTARQSGERRYDGTVCVQLLDRGKWFLQTFLRPTDAEGDGWSCDALADYLDGICDEARERLTGELRSIAAG